MGLPHFNPGLPFLNVGLPPPTPRSINEAMYGRHPLLGHYNGPALFHCGPAPLTPRSINEATAAIPCWNVYHDSHGANATLDCGEKTALGAIQASDLFNDPV